MASIDTGASCNTLPPSLSKSDHSPSDFFNSGPSTANSPESSYSLASPSLPHHPDQAFQYGPEDHEVYETDLFDELRSEDVDASGESVAPLPGGETSEWSDPTWATWSTVGGTSLAWDPSRTRNSVISISPRGSADNCRASGPRGSLSKRLSLSIVAPSLGSTFGPRRKSNPNLLGFDLLPPSGRRRSSTKSVSSSHAGGGGRRRSSVYSAASAGSDVSSLFDPLETARLRNIASMDLLRRRFSEVVEVISASDDDDGLEGSARAQSGGSGARGTEAASVRASFSESSVGDDSEVHTASYAPTPELQPGSVPSVYSNFPLESVALPVNQAPDTGSEYDPSSNLAFLDSPSPLYVSRLDATPQSTGTPIIAARRPGLVRATTTVDRPPVPTPFVDAGGAGATRPCLIRSISNPLLSAELLYREPTPANQVHRTGPAVGTFPLARATPLGVSPLRESLRRQSVLSDGGSRRNSDIGGRRRSSVYPAPRDSQLASQAETADGGEGESEGAMHGRRVSLELAKEELRRMSTDLGRDSQILRRDSRLPSTSNAGLHCRDPSFDTLVSCESYASQSTRGSRRSSAASIDQYGYLAQEITIDTPRIMSASFVNLVPAAPQPAVPAPTLTSTASPNVRLRANAPPSIILPSYRFPQPIDSSSLSSPTPTSNPMDVFFGRNTPGSSDSGQLITPSTGFTTLSPSMGAQALIPPTSSSPKSYTHHVKSPSRPNVSLKTPVIEEPPSPKSPFVPFSTRDPDPSAQSNYIESTATARTRGGAESPFRFEQTGPMHDALPISELETEARPKTRRGLSPGVGSEFATSPYQPPKEVVMSPAMEMDHDGRLRVILRPQTVAPSVAHGPRPKARLIPILRTPDMDPGLRPGTDSYFLPHPASRTGPPGNGQPSSVRFSAGIGQTHSTRTVLKTASEQGKSHSRSRPRSPVPVPVQADGLSPPTPSTMGTSTTPSSPTQTRQVRVRSITFLDLEPPRRQKLDRKSSFTRFFQAISKGSSSPSSP